MPLPAQRAATIACGASLAKVEVGLKSPSLLTMYADESRQIKDLGKIRHAVMFCISAGIPVPSTPTFQTTLSGLKE